jgi:CRISPR-associated protein Cas8a1/Csx13
MATTMTLRLNAPGMTALHKAGLAGLYMTLQAFDETEQTIEGLQWQLESQQVILTWTENTPRAAFEKLIKKSFWIDDKGFIRLAGLEPEREMTYAQRHHLYNSLLNSFLQYGKHRKKAAPTTLNYEVGDGKIHWLKDFEPITAFMHRKVADDPKVANEWIDGKGFFKKEVGVIGWLYPGGSTKHSDSSLKNDTTMREPFEAALTLLYAPVGTIYYLINSREKGRKARLALLIPTIRDLEEYSDIRRVIASQDSLDLTASSASDALLRMLLTIRTGKTLGEMEESVSFRKKHPSKTGAQAQRRPPVVNSFVCRVITFGIVKWNEKQKTRTHTYTIFTGDLPGLENYRLASAIFKNRHQKINATLNGRGEITQPERHFVTTFSSRELIADNIAHSRAWYHGIADYAIRRDTTAKDPSEQLFSRLDHFERKELGRMVKEAEFENERESLFIKACHKSWQQRLGQLGERARTENLGDEGFRHLREREAERLRTSLARCKNAETLRETVVSFWSRGGNNEYLQRGGLAQVLPLFEGSSWRKAKDLTLLSLISYQTPDRLIDVSPEQTNKSEGDDEK